MEKSTVVLLVCCAYFAVMILVGILVMSRNRKASDFLVAGRKLNLLFSVATLSAVQIGAGIILGGSSTGASMGVWPGMWYALGCGGGLILAGLLVAATGVGISRLATDAGNAVAAAGGDPHGGNFIETALNLVTAASAQLM